MLHKKTILFLLIFGGLFGLEGCKESTLNLKPASLTEETFFQNQQEMESAVFGIYSKMTDLFWYNSINFLHDAWLLPGDDITTTEQNAFEIFGTLGPGNGTLNQHFSTAYNIIRRANTVLDNAEKATYSDPQRKDIHRGEALFLRAYMYFQLWNYYGTAPLITSRATTTEALRPGNSEGTQLLDQAIQDLQQAAGLLPESWDSRNLGRVTKNSANGLLGKVLVFRATVNKAQADYQAAINAFNSLNNVSLVPNYADNFSAATENNAESLFEFQASQSAQDNVWLNNDFDNQVGAMSAYWGFYSGHWSLFGRPKYIATGKLLTAYEAGDSRKAVTLNESDGSIVKYVVNDQANPNEVGSLNNPRLLRYADILLLKAEALVQSGGSTGEAVALINQVRARARGNGSAPANRDESVADRSKILQWIIEERLLELSGEGQRWIDLRRWHFGGIIQLTDAFFSSESPSIAFNPNVHLYFPIPTNEVDLNPNIKQNPGY